MRSDPPSLVAHDPACLCEQSTITVLVDGVQGRPFRAMMRLSGLLYPLYIDQRRDDDPETDKGGERLTTVIVRLSSPRRSKRMVLITSTDPPPTRSGIANQYLVIEKYPRPSQIARRPPLHPRPRMDSRRVGGRGPRVLVHQCFVARPASRPQRRRDGNLGSSAGEVPKYLAAGGFPLGELRTPYPLVSCNASWLAIVRIFK